MTKIIAKLRTNGRYTVDDVCRKFKNELRPLNFTAFMEREIKLKELAGKRGTAKAYRSSLNSLQRFLASQGKRMDCPDGALIEEYQSWLLDKGVCANSVSFYMRPLRAVYKRMVKEGLTEDTEPFADVYTGVRKTRKRAITESEMKRLKSLDLAYMPSLEFARDMFFLSFYLRGMAYVDLCQLKKSDIQGSQLSYRRAKTGSAINIGINVKISRMLDKYPSSTHYLLPIIKNRCKDERRQYETAIRVANRNLKIIGTMAGLPTPLTTYTARHTWASIARQKKVELSIISEALGHQSEATTRIYISSLDTSHIDRANNLILKGL